MPIKNNSRCRTRQSTERKMSYCEKKTERTLIGEKDKLGGNDQHY